jgi:hypothetical protein
MAAVMSVWMWAVRVGGDYCTEGDSKNHAGLGVCSVYLCCGISVRALYSGGTRLRHCAKSRQVAGSIPNGAIFYWHNPSGRTMALGSTQPLTGYQEYFMGGWRRPVHRADNFTAFMCRLSGNLGSHPAGTPRAGPVLLQRLRYLSILAPLSACSYCIELGHSIDVVVLKFKSFELLQYICVIIRYKVYCT